MEKFLWKLAEALLFVSNILTVLLFVAFENFVCFVLVLLVLALDLIYKEKCPTWIEV